MRRIQFVFVVIAVSLLSTGLALAQENPMTFFVTSQGPGEGSNFGGLTGADLHCQMLATDAGAGALTWRAYLSTQGPNAVDARDRIGTGPWHNAQGVLVGQDVDEMHGMLHRFNFSRMLDEGGNLIPGGGFSPNRHDVLTGTQPDGTAYGDDEDMTCGNWTSSDAGKARIGHHDRAAWNSAHDSRGCSQEQLRSSGGDGLIYCFAAQ